VVPYYDPDGTLIGSIHIARDINEQKKAAQEKEKLHSQLLHAQKLESVGQLAAGIAHEINTPTQFIGTNIDFLGEAAQDISDFMEQIEQIAESGPQEIKDAINKALEEMDWEYLAEEIPLAITQSHEGVKRVSSIVRAMKEFSHPGSKEKESQSLNRIIETREVADAVELRLSDTGSGIPEQAIPRIFDPFYTTKKVGKGTGQGLAISHDVITEKHGGSIRFSTERDKGTEFIILLPETAS